MLLSDLVATIPLPMFAIVFRRPTRELADPSFSDGLMAPDVTTEVSWHVGHVKPRVKVPPSVLMFVNTGTGILVTPEAVACTHPVVSYVQS